MRDTPREKRCCFRQKVKSRRSANGESHFRPKYFIVIIPFGTFIIYARNTVNVFACLVCISIIKREIQLEKYTKIVFIEVHT